jgi:RNA polymerase sigma-70 factor (ECF subfamily)
MMASCVAENWKGWLTEHGSKLLLFARSWCQSRQDAEDLVQEAVLKMWHHQADRGHLPPDLPLIFSTIRFCGLNFHRSERRRKKREESVTYLNDFQNMWLDPVLEDDEDALLLRDKIKDLSPKLREVVIMKFWGDLTFQQIAETLDISPNTAASRYRYALEQLAQQLRGIKEDRRAQA